MRKAGRGVLLLLAGALLAGCDRRIEPYVPGEEPEQPDLSRIFPAGAQPREPAAELPPPPPRRGAPSLAAEAAAAAVPIRGRVVLAPELRDRAPEGAVLFLIARRGESGPPVAVKRIADPRFPLDFAIGPEDRMIEAIPFAGPLRLSARLDRDGNATSRSAGDLEGGADGAHEPGARGVEVRLGRILE